MICHLHLDAEIQAKYVDPEKAMEAKERGNEHFRAGQWAKAIEEYEEVRVNIHNIPYQGKRRCSANAAKGV